MKPIARDALSVILVLLCGVAFGACHGPTAPTPTPGPTSQTNQTNRAITVSGTVVDNSGRPVYAASVLARGTQWQTTYTDQAGRFSQRLTVPASTTSITVNTGRNGYLSSSRTLEVAPQGTSALDLTIELTSQMTALSVGQTLPAEISSAYEPCYVGEPYDSDYGRHCRVFSLTSNGDADVIVELRWTGTTPLQLWAVDGFEVTQGIAASQPATLVLTVPRNKTVQVLATVPYTVPSLPMPLGFTLSATRAS